MRIDRVKLIAEMARQDMRIADVCDKGNVSRATVCAARSGKSVSRLSAKRIATALGVSMEVLLEENENNSPAQ